MKNRSLFFYNFTKSTQYFATSLYSSRNLQMTQINSSFGSSFSESRWLPKEITDKLDEKQKRSARAARLEKLFKIAQLTYFSKSNETTSEKNFTARLSTERGKTKNEISHDKTISKSENISSRDEEPKSIKKNSKSKNENFEIDTSFRTGEVCGWVISVKHSAISLNSYENPTNLSLSSSVKKTESYFNWGIDRENFQSTQVLPYKQRNKITPVIMPIKNWYDSFYSKRFFFRFILPKGKILGRTEKNKNEVQNSLFSKKLTFVSQWNNNFYSKRAGRTEKLIKKRERNSGLNNLLPTPSRSDPGGMTFLNTPEKDKNTLLIYIAIAKQLQVGDKMSGRHGNKGIISKILPFYDMPYLIDGTPIDIVLNPLGVPSRMNVGQIYESLLGLTGFYKNEYYRIPPFDENYDFQFSRNFVYWKLNELNKQQYNFYWSLSSRVGETERKSFSFLDSSRIVYPKFLPNEQRWRSGQFEAKGIDIKLFFPNAKGYFKKRKKSLEYQKNESARAARLRKINPVSLLGFIKTRQNFDQKTINESKVINPIKNWHDESQNKKKTWASRKTMNNKNKSDRLFLIKDELQRERIYPLAKIGLNPYFPGKMRLLDGRTGETFYRPIIVGKSYMLKLIHLVDNKIHARATGPYALITQQPLKGKRNQGGQRVGEMEVWAFYAFGSASLLFEMLTTKSDDPVGRERVLREIAGLPKDPLDKGISEAFRVLVMNLRALCLDLSVFKDFKSRINLI